MTTNYDEITTVETDDFGDRKVITTRRYDNGLVETFVAFDLDNGDELVEVEVIDDEEVYEAEVVDE